MGWRYSARSSRPEVVSLQGFALSNCHKHRSVRSLPNACPPVSGIVGLLARRLPPDHLGLAAAMLARASFRGADRSDVWRDEFNAAALAVARHGWELQEGFGGPVLVATDGAIAVAADATLYYQDDLRRALKHAGVPLRGTTASHLILAAYRAWGERCAERLEGDFAFVIWDADEHRAVCARDFGGKRPLFYAQLGNTFAVASTISSILAHPECPHDLDLASIAADAAGLFAASRETGYRAISVVPAGGTLVWRDGTARLTRHWSSPLVHEGAGPPFDAAADELRQLLQSAVAERLDPHGPTSVWLSGGWDSTAAFAAGEQALRDKGAARHLHAVSISFPLKDPGREDELIAAVADHWGSPVHWLDIAHVPLLDRPLERAAERDEPFAHAFEMGNRALAAGSRAVGARVALDGVGGDQLFQVSNIYLADLLRTGRWHALAREWRLKGMSGSGFRSFFRWAVQPLLPPSLLAAAAILRRGRPLRGYLERSLPEWIDRGFARRHGLVEREWLHTPKRVGPSRAAYETSWFLDYPYFPQVFASVAAFGLEHGVEVRSPLYDRRVIEFAASRPRPERSEGRETKRLLRRAMRGLLPDHVLAPRPVRTGITGGYFARSLRKTHADFLGKVVAEPMLLAELGIVNAALLRQRWNDYLRHGGGDLGVSLFLTLQVELWLRARGDSCTRSAPIGRDSLNAPLPWRSGYSNLDAAGCAVSGHGHRARNPLDTREELCTR